MLGTDAKTRQAPHNSWTTTPQHGTRNATERDMSNMSFDSPLTDMDMRVEVPCGNQQQGGEDHYKTTRHKRRRPSGGWGPEDDDEVAEDSSPSVHAQQNCQVSFATPLAPTRPDCTPLTKSCEPSVARASTSGSFSFHTSTIGTPTLMETRQETRVFRNHVSIQAQSPEPTMHAKALWETPAASHFRSSGDVGSNSEGTPLCYSSLTIK